MLRLRLEIGVLMLPAYRLPCVVLTVNWVNSNDCWRHTCVWLPIWQIITDYVHTH